MRDTGLGLSRYGRNDGIATRCVYDAQPATPCNAGTVFDARIYGKESEAHTLGD
jgi:hypothetical protein